MKSNRSYILFSLSIAFIYVIFGLLVIRFNRELTDNLLGRLGFFETIFSPVVLAALYIGYKDGTWFDLIKILFVEFLIATILCFSALKLFFYLKDTLVKIWQK